MFGARVSPRVSPGAFVPVIVLGFSVAAYAQETFQPVSLTSRITHVQPMTGIVLWSTSEHNRTERDPARIQLHEVR